MQRKSREDRLKDKADYIDQLLQYCAEYKKILIFTSENVNSHQMMEVRTSLRGKAVLLMGKKTLMRRALKLHLKEKPDSPLKNLLPHLVGNIGLCFTNEDAGDIRDIIVENKVSQPAKLNQIAISDVVIPKGPTKLEPTKTSLFQAINIQTKITRGCIDILSDCKILKVGDKVDQSICNLLKLLDIKPFFFGLEVQKVYDNGVVFDTSVLDFTDEDYAGFFQEGIQNITAISVETGVPVESAVPHNIMSTFRDILSIGLTLEKYEMEELKGIKEYLADPSKFAVVEEKKEEKKEDKEEEEEEEEEESEDEDMGFGGLF